METGRSYFGQKWNPTQRPMARWILRSFVGIPALYAGLYHLVLNLNKHHQAMISMPERSYEQVYKSQFR
jgi:hypothetical protein